VGGAEGSDLFYRGLVAPRAGKGAVFSHFIDLNEYVHGRREERNDRKGDEEGKGFDTENEDRRVERGGIKKCADRGASGTVDQCRPTDDKAIVSRAASECTQSRSLQDSISASLSHCFECERICVNTRSNFKLYPVMGLDQMTVNKFEYFSLPVKKFEYFGCHSVCKKSVGSRECIDCVKSRKLWRFGRGEVRGATDKRAVRGRLLKDLSIPFNS
jgi:hypothetical protein